MAQQWTVTEEFSQRLGCGLATAVLLPVWFAIGVFALNGSTVALALSLVFFVAAVCGGTAAFLRTRRVPRTIELDAEADRLTFVSRAGRTDRPAGALTGVTIGTSLGIAPVRLHFADAPPVRVPRELDGFDSFLAALGALRPELPVTDRNRR